MKKVKIFNLFIVALVLLLGGCNDKKTIKEVLPDDTPWNNGEYAIMETEKGYYFNPEDLLYLRYHDKKTGREIMLCDKPECKHDGNEECTATYKGLRTGRNKILYNGYIYFTGLDENNGILEAGLYRASADGTSIERVGKYLDAKFISDEYYDDRSVFIIHRGYAYIGYYIEKTIGSYAGFIGSGFVRINIKTGDVEEINSCDDYFSITNIGDLQGCGDYVYLYIFGGAYESGWYRYNINDRKMSLLDQLPDHGNIQAVTNDKIYISQYNEENKFTELFALDSSTFEKLDGVIRWSNSMYDVLAYDGKVFICEPGKVSVYKDNKSVGSIALSGEANSEEKNLYIYLFKISDGKLYYINFIYPKIDVHFCSIDDIISGNGQWSPAYSVDEYDKQWMDYFCSINK